MRTFAAQDFAPPTDNDRRGVQSPPRQQLKIVTPAQVPKRGWQQWERHRRPSQPSPQSPQGHGLALDSQAPRSANEGPSPMTPSHRTHSQLLPDKPTTYSLFPAPPPKSARRASQSLNPHIPSYAPEKSPPMAGPRFPSSVDTSQANMQGYNGHRSMSDPFYDDLQRTPSGGYRGIPWTDQPTSVRRPPSMYQPYRAAPVPEGSQLRSLPEDYPPPPQLARDQVNSILRSHSRRYPTRKKSAGSSQYTRFSNASESTTFEDIDEDLPTQSRSVLSPVAEMRSPPRRATSVLNRPRPIPRRVGHEEISGPNEDVTQSAKYKILVSPGLQSLDKSMSSSPVTPTTVQRTPQRTPPMRASRPWSQGL
ncbi:uncharacterized protein KY384_008250 [Bacidia gigantensis]|uniref:uncharacterized protein n=1 Tax=Bacidia gigantensis TaxID=2732470 RepID=UPI001D03BB5A|nr:uncharacterized protein KY384_008250 [Bacidia gigantensis]KAG8526821.1 hypothetical protein KY384_008250 [Bacidia gigantensis]